MKTLLDPGVTENDSLCEGYDNEAELYLHGREEFIGASIESIMNLSLEDCAGFIATQLKFGPIDADTMSFFGGLVHNFCCRQARGCASVAWRQLPIRIGLLIYSPQEGVNPERLSQLASSCNPSERLVHIVTNEDAPFNYRLGGHLFEIDETQAYYHTESAWAIIRALGYLYLSNPTSVWWNDFWKVTMRNIENYLREFASYNGVFLQRHYDLAPGEEELGIPQLGEYLDALKKLEVYK